MDDKQFVLALLGDYGKDVAQTTLALLKNEITTADYIEEAREQFRVYGLALLEWKNGCVSSISDTERDSAKLQASHTGDGL